MKKLCLSLLLVFVATKSQGQTAVISLDELFNPAGSEIGIDWQTVLGSSASNSNFKDAAAPQFGTDYDSGLVDFIDGPTGTVGATDGNWDVRVQYEEIQGDFPNFTASGIASQRDRFNPSASSSAGGGFEINDQVEGGADFGSRNIQQLTVTFGPGLQVEAEDLTLMVDSLNSSGDRYEWASIEILSSSTTSWTDTGSSSFLKDLYETSTSAGTGLLPNGSISPGVGGAGGVNGNITGWFFATDDNTDSGDQNGGILVGSGSAFSYVGSTSPGARPGSTSAASTETFTGQDTGLAATQSITGFVWRQYVDEIDSFTGDSAGTYVARLDFSLSNVVAVPEPSSLLLLIPPGMLVCFRCWYSGLSLV